MSRHRSKLPPFVPLLRETLDSAAWGAMSHGARSLYVALKRRYNSDFHNNGKIYCRCAMRRKRSDQGARKSCAGSANCNTTASSS